MTTEVVKNCNNCAHRSPGFGYSECMVTGFMLDTTRMCAGSQTCDVNFSAWQKRSGLFRRIFDYFFG